MMTLELFAKMDDATVDKSLSKILGSPIRPSGANPWTQCLYRCFAVESHLSAVDYKVFLQTLSILSPKRTASAPPSLRARALYFTLQGR